MDKVLAMYAGVSILLLIVDHIFAAGETRKSWEEDDGLHH